LFATPRSKKIKGRWAILKSFKRLYYFKEGDEIMYSPKIKEDLVPSLYKIAKRQRKPVNNLS